MMVTGRIIREFISSALCSELYPLFKECNEKKHLKVESEEEEYIKDAVEKNSLGWYLNSPWERALCA